jgi:hypothetical protein
VHRELVVRRTQQFIERRPEVNVRVVRFADVTPERVEQIVAAINEVDGPPPSVPVTGLQLLFDEAQGTAVVLQIFDKAEDMSEAAKAFSVMDPSDTPGTRVSVEMCKLTLDRRVTG